MRRTVFKHDDPPSRGDIEGGCKLVVEYENTSNKGLGIESKEQHDTLIFFMVSLVISLLTHKIAHIILDNSNGGLLNLTSMKGYLWVPSIFLPDSFFIVAAYFILSCTLTGIQKNAARMVVWKVAGGVLCTLTFLVSSVEIQSWLSFKEAFPWHLMHDFITQWENTKVMAKEASKQEGFVRIEIVWCLQIPGTGLSSQLNSLIISQFLFKPILK